MSQPATEQAGDGPLAASIGDFDHHADTYREDVENAIAWSGKDVDYFAEGKAKLLVALAKRRLGDPAKLRALDVGCGVGVTDRFLTGTFGQLHGVDIAFTICVVHHVPTIAWPLFAAEMKRVVRPGGLVAVFEHNPLNPFTRVSVSRCPFDEDVTLLRAGTTARLLDEAGLHPVERRFFYFLPVRDVAASRVERALRRVPLGAQYFVAAQA